MAACPLSRPSVLLGRRWERVRVRALRRSATPEARTDTVLSTIFEVDFGWLGLARSIVGIKLVTLPKERREDCLTEIEAQLGHTTPDHSAFADLRSRLCDYFRGIPVTFSDPLDLSGATPFRRAAWEAARTIPYGETRSYAWLAGTLGKPGGARAVGQAMGANPVPLIVPCHRVVGSDGGLCGFGGGLDLKAHLLRLEGVLADEADAILPRLHMGRPE
ncbi:MAG: methylated-DNA--[protein]-cysteine S-methyltransferase [Chloroflexi bacterium]|nr:methylated-DNA--[protein]-cysteine S-methyltransferase [Chloroflexota bacterium]